MRFYFYKKFFCIIIFVLLFIFIFFGASQALAGSATLIWNANSESDLAGYKIYYGASARTGADPKVCSLCGYTSVINANNATTYTISNLTDGQKYYFSISAYDTSNNESAFSAESNKTISASVEICTAFIYSDWGACQSNNTQSRTVITSSPAGCTGGSRILAQSCAYAGAANTTGGDKAVSDVTPPGQPTDFRASTSSAGVLLKWQNPSDFDLSGVIIMRSVSVIGGNTSYRDITNTATKIYQGIAESYLDKTVVANTKYYYAIFSYDTSSNYATAKAINIVSGNNIAQTTKAEDEINESEQIYNHNALVTFDDKERLLYEKLNLGAEANLTMKNKYSFAYFISEGTLTTAQIGADGRAHTLIAYRNIYGAYPIALSDWQKALELADNENLSNDLAKNQLNIIAQEALWIYNRNIFVPLNDTTIPLYNKLNIILDANLKIKDKYSLAFFIHDGTASTKNLGAGERAGVLTSYYSAYSRFPKSLSDWQDALKIANGRWPGAVSQAAENAAKATFKKIYKRDINVRNDSDVIAIKIIAYGLRPSQRNLNSEKAAIKSFKYIYSHAPNSASAWDIARAIAYSGAKR